MKNVKLIIIGTLFLGTLFLLGVSAAAAQSLGDYAREARKNKGETSSSSHHYDNDNLPTNQVVSVVGRPPANDDKAAPAAETASSAPAVKAPAVDPAAAADERQKASDEVQRKIDKQKEKIDWLSHDLDLEQREYRLRAAALYGDAGNRLRNSAQWDKEEAQYKSDFAGKQKALDSARQELDQLQEQARKAGVDQNDRDKSNGKDRDAGKDNSKDKDDNKDKDKDTSKNK
jgi:hypothetical protein